MAQTQSAAQLLEHAKVIGRARRDLLLEGFTSFEKFAGLLQIVVKNTSGENAGRQPFCLNPIQRAYCRRQSQRDIVLKGRQVGFTTLEQARDVWHFLTVPGARVVTMAHSTSEGTPLKLLSATYRVFFDSLRKLGLKLNFRTETGSEWVLADRDATLRLLGAGASEEAAAKKGRAGTITRCHLSEVGFYTYAEVTLNALLECVPGVETGSEIVFESTPNGAIGVFYEQWKAAVDGTSGYRPHFFPWHMQPEYRTALQPGETIEALGERERNLDPEQIKWYRQKVAIKGQALTDQEYPSDPDTCWITSGKSYFDVSILGKLIVKARAVTPLKMFHVKRRGTQGVVSIAPSDPMSCGDARRAGADGTIRVWAEPEKGSSYVVSLDPSQGVGKDAAAGIVLERGTGRHAATIWGNFTPAEITRLAIILAKSYNDAEIAPERTNHGQAVLVLLLIGFASVGLKGPWPNIFIDLDGKEGWNPTPQSRTLAIDLLDEAIRLGHVKSLDAELLSEMLSFVQNDHGKAAAAPGAHDDLVSAMYIGWAATTRRRPPTRDYSALPSR